jgi:hypothetical protein
MLIVLCAMLLLTKAKFPTVLEMMTDFDARPWVNFPIRQAENRMGSYPYASDEAPRFFSDYVYRYDENRICFAQGSWLPEEVRRGASIWIQTECVTPWIRDWHARIGVSYVLITGNSDRTLPIRRSQNTEESELHANFVRDSKLHRWFVRNLNSFGELGWDISDHALEAEYNRKVFPWPIMFGGLRLSGQASVLSRVEDAVKEHRKAHPIPSSDPGDPFFLYTYFTVETNVPVRSAVKQLLHDKHLLRPFVKVGEEENLLLMSNFTYVVSPAGNGPDCHRTWEAVFLGSFPIVITSALDPLFEDLPVLILHDWSELDNELLKKNLPYIYTPGVFLIGVESRDLFIDCDFSWSKHPFCGLVRTSVVDC